MKEFLVLTLLALLSSTLAAEYGHCQFSALTGNGGAVTGYAYVGTNANDATKIDIQISVSGLAFPSADHGVHIHEFGDLSVTSGASLGSHYDPLLAGHGCPENATRQLGDTGNWAVDSLGSITQTKTLNLLELKGTNSIIGRAITIHASTDNCVTVPSSGARLASCVIGIRNMTGIPNPAVNGNGAITKAICVLSPTSNGAGISGVVTFEQATPTGSTVVKAKIDGLVTDSIHGFHIHEWGDISSAAGTNAGYHYNPTNSNHGIPNNTPRHLGDMGNVFYHTGGSAYYSFTHNMISLNGANNVIGRGLILHQLKDNCSQPLGAAGTRFAQCVIGIANPTSNVTFPETPVPSTQDTADCPVETTTDDSSNTSNASLLHVELLLVFVAIIALGVHVIHQ